MPEASESRYALSFTVGGLLVREALQTLTLWHSLRDWDAVRAELMNSNSLQQRTVQSRRTMSREVVGRLSELVDPELDLLSEGSSQEQAELMWVAACRRYGLLAEFAEEVVRERFLLLTPTLTLTDFDVFVRGKSMWHAELNDLAESTGRKLRQNTFRMLREAGLIGEDGVILRTILSPRLDDLLRERSPSDVRFFPTSVAVTG